MLFLSSIFFFPLSFVCAIFSFWLSGYICPLGYSLLPHIYIDLHCPSDNNLTTLSNLLKSQADSHWWVSYYPLPKSCRIGTCSCMGLVARQNLSVTLMFSVPLHHTSAHNSQIRAYKNDVLLYEQG